MDTIDRIPGSDKITTWSSNFAKCFSTAATSVRFKYENFVSYTITRVYKFDKTDPTKALVVESTSVKDTKFTSDEKDTLAPGQNTV